MKYFFVLIFIVFAHDAAAYSLEEGRSYEAQARAAFAADDLAQAVVHFSAALGERPGHPGYLFNIAYLEATLGRNDAALRSLAAYADLGLVTNLDREVFAALQGLDDFARIADRIARNNEAEGEASQAFETDHVIALAEGIAYDSGRDRFYITGLHDRAIYAVTPEGVTTPLVVANGEGLFAASGIRYDDVRDLIWVASPAVEQMRGYDVASAGTSGIFAFKASNGELVHRYVFMKSEESDYFFGDILIADNGDIFVTNSLAGIIIHCNADGMVQNIIELSNASSLQGLVFNEDQSLIYVADYSSGIHILDPSSGENRLMETPAGDTLLGIDGLYEYGGNLIAIQNGINPNRVLGIGLSDDGGEINSIEVLVANHEALEEPTLGVIVGNAFYFIANSQWPRFADPADITPEMLAGLDRTIVLRIELD